MTRCGTSGSKQPQVLEPIPQMPTLWRRREIPVVPQWRLGWQLKSAWALLSLDWEWFQRSRAFVAPRTLAQERDHETR